MAHVPSTAIGMQLPCRAERAQLVEHDEQRRHQHFQHRDKNKIAQRLGQKKRIRRRRRNPISVEHLIAQLARPGLIKRHHRGKKKCHPNQSAGDLARFFGVGIERKTEDHDHQQRKKQHGVDRVFRSPLQAQVFGQRGPGDAFADAADWLIGSRSGCSLMRSFEFSSIGCSSRVRRVICPASIQTNSSAAPSSNDAWWVTTKIVLPASRICARSRDHRVRGTEIHVGKRLVQQQDFRVVQQGSRQR